MSSRESLHAELAATQATKASFDTALEKAIATGDTTEAERLQVELTDKIQALKEKLNPFEARLHLKEQYETQKTTLAKVGILEPLRDGSLGIKGVDGKDYTFPSYQEVANRLKEKKEVISQKTAQGFTKLQIVPFGMSLDQLFEKYKAALQKHFDENKLFYTKKNQDDLNEPLEPITKLNDDGPLYIWDKYNQADTNGNLVYYPTQFTKDNHGGMTKAEVLARDKQGWQIELHEDLPNIPRGGKEKTVGGRPQLDTAGTSIASFIAQGQTIPCPTEYLKAIQNNQIYRHERGMTPEDQLTYALTHLEATNQVIDDYAGKGSFSYQLGAWFPASGHVPGAFWRRGVHRAYMGRRGPGGRVDSCGVRSAVGV
ncbi:MAG: hypothetical protein A3D53_02225 [Candidatus Magasanikbacteria bacterium RIFCSPHIGHO2_02_FULL_45_10]|uniref:Uncharacterized protein n=1 Tax=Candidatus Magasanikbacteria bacterium RIFCSPHIGHO2_02_FULL_45_10 TaxID=1798679 RepID=A0A1F6MAI6_9BACT|nr:MAG: hypothetical protein A3D53_02225 [Candidatus Magasanikbacteria bacterium RIFCSPHIGHO2_02_FULL_45_10]